MAHPVLKVGLTGGIASGKSTVAGFLTELGALVVDGDDIAHAVIEPAGPAYAAVVDRFGDGVVAGDGTIDRKALGAIVFADPDARGALNRIVHPHVRDEADRRFAEYARTGHAPIGVFDAALLVETGAFRDHDRLIVVKCSQQAQLQRLMRRGGLTTAEALQRIHSQLPVAAKVAVADYVVDTEGTIKESREQTEAIYRSLLTDWETEFGGPERTRA